MEESCTIYIVLLIITLVVCFFIFICIGKKTVSVEYINLAATYVKMLNYNKINVLEGTDINKSNKPKRRMICHFWYFKVIGYKYESYVSNGCHDISMMAYKLENVSIQNAKGVDYRCAIWNMIRNDAINRLNNSELDDKGSL